jgi:hypothetical protein
MTRQSKSVFTFAALALGTGALLNFAHASSPDWTSKLNDPNVQAAINQCLLAHPKSQFTPMVETIWDASRDEIGIKTVDLSGRRQSCFADRATGKISNVAPEFEATGPLFVSARLHSTPPRGQCIVAKPVLAGSQLQGWLITQRPPHNGNQPDECSSPVWADLR